MESTTQPNTDAIDLSIILVNWNSLSFTSEALASIRAQTHGIRYEAIVVDNGSTKDESVKVLPEQFPWITLLTNNGNLGFSKANNRGIAIARGRYVLLLNNDTIQIEDALTKAVAYMDAHPDLGACGILHLNNDATRSRQPSAFSFTLPSTMVGGLLGFSGTKPPQHPTSEQDVDWVVGSFLLMRRQCLEQVGPLDERFFIYEEDVDWCKRAHSAGWKIRFWPGASMIHVGSAANPLMKDKTFIHFRSMLSYFKKHHGNVAAGSYYLAMSLRMTMGSVAQVGKLAMGKTTLDDARKRWRRQKQFMALNAGKIGG